MIKFSIIIPFKSMNDYLKKCIQELLKQSYKNFEIILLPDYDLKFKGVKVIPTGPVKPSLKRNIGAKKAKGEILAFIDDDAYPDYNWMKNVLKYFKEDVGAVGGPNLTPKEDNIWQKASGDVLSSPIGAGKFALRYVVRKGQAVKELPSCNLFVRKNLFKGFDTSLLTAEDSKLCFSIRKMGKKVIYAPDVKVYHHRRELFRPHLKQVFIYGRDKAWLIKEDFSLDKLYYLAPFVFVLGLFFGGIVSAFVLPIKYLYLAFLGIYLLISLFSSLTQNLERSFLIFPGIILTHIFYGLGSLYGLLKKK